MRLTWARALAGLTLCAVTTCADPAPTTGSLIIEIVGVPASVQASVVVSGDAGFRRVVTTTTTIDGLSPGGYVVSSGVLSTPAALYEPETLTRHVSVVAGQTHSVRFPFVLASGSIDLTATGLPAGVGPHVAIAGSTYVRTVTVAGLIHALPPGQYVVRADTFAAATGDRFGATVVEQPVTITASLTPVPVSVAYGPASGTLALAVSGFNDDAGDAVTISGDNGFVVKTSTSVVLRGLRPGAYSVTPRQIILCPNVYTPITAERSYDVALAQVTDASVVFERSQPGPETLNFAIDKAYLTQAVQNTSATLPIIAERTALLRVFGNANQCHTATPAVKIRLSSGDSIVIPQPDPVARFEPQLPAFMTSWSALVPAALVRPGLTFEAFIDPENAIAEANEDDNRFPASGSSTQIVATMPPFDLAFVPITQAGVTGNVNEGNLPEYLYAARQMLPLGVINSTVGPSYTTNVVLGNGTTSAFVSILQELDVKRVQDGVTSNYYGVLRPAPGINFVQVGGIAYIGGKTALGITVGWFNDLRQATELVAHELSHNFGQRHAPCGSAGGPDPAFPYADGAIGVTGYDLYNATDLIHVDVKSPTTPDIMGYCSDPWISDYTYGRIINFRSPPVVTLAASVVEPQRTSTLLVSGMVSPDSVRLDPAFQIVTRPALPAATGPYSIEGRASDGTILFQTSFMPQPTDHGDPSVRYFTFAIPVAETALSRLSQLELVGDRGRVTRRSGGSSDRVRLVAPDAAADEAGAIVTSRSASIADVEWDAARWPAILIRDAATQTLLGIGRGGRATVATRAATIELVMSDGARSATVRTLVRGR